MQAPVSDERLAESYKAVKEHGTIQAAHEATGASWSTLKRHVKEYERRQKAGNSPDSYIVKGRSTLLDGEGNVRAQWVKEQLDNEQVRAALQETVRAFTSPLKGLAKPTKPPKVTQKDLRTEYILTDLHLGQYSWHEETGEDYDIEKATRLAAAAMDRLIESVPTTETALLNQMGDYFHADSNTPVTPRGGNVLDTDTRHRKVVRSGISLAKYAVERMLEKHKTVEVRNTPGNHDIHSAIVLDEALIAYFYNEPRVIVHDSPKAFWAYRFGKCLVGIAHGHAPKPNKLPGLLAADYPEWWGETEFKYCRHGHLHHEKMDTDMGVRCEGFPTLAAKDAWGTGEGYRSSRQMVADVLHKDFGQQERHYASVKRLNNA